MKKSLLVLALMGIMVVNVAACGQAKVEPEAPATEETASETAAEDAEAATEDTETPAESSEEATDAPVGLANPWRDCEEADVWDYAPNGFSAPEGASNVKWSLMEVEDNTTLPGTMVQMTFDLDDISFVARQQPVAGEEIVDISGMNYEWDVTDEGTLQNWGGGNMPCRISRHIGEDEYVDICLWFDIETGHAYSLSAEGKDLDGFDIQAIAEQIYDPAKQIGANAPD